MLVKAVVAAELVDTLNTGGPFTVFAPKNSAFAKIPPDTLNELLDDKEGLTSVSDNYKKTFIRAAVSQYFYFISSGMQICY